MRISNEEEQITAYDIVNWYPQQYIENILLDFGEEKYAPIISKAIVLFRNKHGPINSTKALADIIRKVVPKTWMSKKHMYSDPATKSFQALRIKVNDELGELLKGLNSAFNTVGQGGYIAVVTFHSLEDGIAKSFIESKTKGRFHIIIFKTRG
jgi:16S rRNA (cytosine1402-N4)-methyltransferase